MCKLGDIIVVDEYLGEDGVKLTKHSFVVIDDNKNNIKGLDYDFIAPVMSSFKDKEHKEKVLSYPVNKEITNEDIQGEFKLKKESYIKTNKLYYFDKNNIKYHILARVTDEFLDELVKIILSLSETDRLSIITNNLSNKE